MSTAERILLIIIFLVCVSSFVIAFLQFKEKGYLFNNAYIYASMEERIRMNKKPYYRQSAIIFTALGMIFLITGLDIILHYGWLLYVEIAFLVFVIIYAIVSSIIINTKHKS